MGIGQTSDGAKWQRYRGALIAAWQGEKQLPSHLAHSVLMDPNGLTFAQMMGLNGVVNSGLGDIAERIRKRLRSIEVQHLTPPMSQ